MTHRVVVTGMSASSPLGENWSTARQRLDRQENCVIFNQDWDEYSDLRSRLACPASDFTKPKHFDRKSTRSMGRVGLMATSVTERALADAKLTNHPMIKDGRMGVSYGSSSGSPAALADFTRMLIAKSMKGITPNTYLRMMPHTAPVNIGVFFGLTGRMLTTCSACTSGSQGIGLAYETIRYGKQKRMISGGAEELDVAQVGIFDNLFATSTKNQKPQATPRPFDQDRDGIVLGEGASTLILEELQHARERGANILAEVVGFHCNSDGMHITQPNTDTMKLCMQGALTDAQLEPEDIGYISAHGTATELGDIAESQATASIFGAHTPISSLKSYIGHTLGACGAIEAWAAIHMMNDNVYAPTLNLQNLDPRCGDLDYIVQGSRKLDTEYVMSNNFAFGGINTSLIFRKWTG